MRLGLLRPSVRHSSGGGPLRRHQDVIFELFFLFACARAREACISLLIKVRFYFALLRSRDGEDWGPRGELSTIRKKVVHNAKESRETASVDK